MTKDQKKLFKSLKKDSFRRSFIQMLIAQQSGLGKYKHWQPAYEQKLKKRGMMFKALFNKKDPPE